MQVGMIDCCGIWLFEWVEKCLQEHCNEFWFFAISFLFLEENSCFFDFLHGFNGNSRRVLETVGLELGIP